MKKWREISFIAHLILLPDCDFIVLFLFLFFVSGIVMMLSFLIL